MSNDTKSTVLELTTDDHRALKYIAQVTGDAQKLVAVRIFQRGLLALAQDPAWVEQVAMHEEQRTAALGRLGLNLAPAAEEPAADAPIEGGLLAAHDA